MSPRRTTPWPAGTPCWLDLVTPDLDAAQAFYAATLGWDYGPGDPAFGGYCRARGRRRARGRTRAGTPGDDPRLDSLRRHRRRRRHGRGHHRCAAARVQGGVMDLGPTGRMVVAQRPDRALSSRRGRPGSTSAVGVHNEPGGLAWEDLRSTDPDAARAFYADVFGWSYQPLPMAGPDYSTIHLGDGPPVGGLGGMMGMDSFPSHWIVYLAVDRHRRHRRRDRGRRRVRPEPRVRHGVRPHGRADRSLRRGLLGRAAHRAGMTPSV